MPLSLKKIQNKGIIIALIIISIIFIVFGHYHKDQVQDTLKVPIFQYKWMIYDFWSLSHTLLFGIFGYLSPGCFYEFLILGAVWELFEDYYSSDQNTQLVNCNGECKTLFDKCAKKIWCGQGNATDNYWYGKADDILANSVGYLLGEYIATGRVSIFG